MGPLGVGKSERGALVLESESVRSFWATLVSVPHVLVGTCGGAGPVEASFRFAVRFKRRRSRSSRGWEVVMPLMMGPGIFIPALIVALIGVGLSACSAYRVRKFPEKYKKNEWGKAALAILGWQILMTVLFAWLLGGLPIG